MRISEVECRTALSASRFPGLDYALNPYRGCSMGCVYCYSPAVLREVRPWGEFVEVRRNLPYVLARELKLRRPGVVGIGTVTDAYQAVEGRYKLTRLCLELLRRHDWPISIQTKSPLIVRDLDVLEGFSKVDVGFSFSVLDSAMARLFEPRAPSVSSRLLAMKRVVSRGIDTWAFLGPILPGVTEGDVAELLGLIAETGVSWVLVDRLRVRPLVWENLRRALRDHPIILFSHRRALWEDPEYFRRIIRRIEYICQELGLTCVETFPERSVSRGGSETTETRHLQAPGTRPRSI